MSSSRKQQPAECSSGFDASRRSPLSSFTFRTLTTEVSHERYPQDGPRNPSPTVFGDDAGDDDDFGLFTAQPDYLMAGSYYPPSFVASAITAVTGSSAITTGLGLLAKQEQERAPAGEGSLLQISRPTIANRPLTGSCSSSILGERLCNRLFDTGAGFGARRSEDGDSALPSRDEGFEASETTTLLGDQQHGCGGDGAPDHDTRLWKEMVASGKMQAEWQQEAKVLARYSSSLILTFMLQYSLTVTSIFSVGHIGKIELGAVSLAGMTANITGYAVYQGLATSLDTLCAQAYGSGNKALVGLHLQRMILFLWVVTIPIGMVWLAGTRILEQIVPHRETAALAGLYLKVVLAGAPGLAAFESGKRFVQAQGLFSATLYVLLFCAPFNAFLNWLFVWVSAANCFHVHTDTDGATASWVGFCRRSNRGGFHGQSATYLPLPVRPLRGWETMLGWIFQESLPELGTYDPTRHPWATHGLG